jgi:hypothetical protein
VEPPQVPLVAVTIPPKVLSVKQPAQQVIPAQATRLPQASVLLVIMQEVTQLLALFVTLVIVLTIPKVLALAINTATQVPDIKSVWIAQRVTPVIAMTLLRSPQQVPMPLVVQVQLLPAHKATIVQIPQLQLKLVAQLVITRHLVQVHVPLWQKVIIPLMVTIPIPVLMVSTLHPACKDVNLAPLVSIVHHLLQFQHLVLKVPTQLVVKDPAQIALNMSHATLKELKPTVATGNTHQKETLLVVPAHPVTIVKVV